MLTSANFSFGVVKKTIQNDCYVLIIFLPNFSFISYSVFEKMRGCGILPPHPPDLRSPKKPSPNRVNNSVFINGGQISLNFNLFA